jgi:hypothetical protein
MTTVQDLDELLDMLDASREQILIAIEPLSDDELMQPGVVGEWSIATTLALLTAWEAELVTGLMKIDQGKRPDRLLQILKNPAPFIENIVEESSERLLDQIFTDWQHVRVKLEGWLEGFSHRELTQPGRFKWFKGKSLADVVLQMTVQQEEKYVDAMAAFANKVTAAEDSAVSDTIIPLATIHPEQEDDSNHSN